MSEIFTLDGYGLYVWSAYGATALILAWLVWSTLSDSRRAKAELDRVERARRR